MGRTAGGRRSSSRLESLIQGRGAAGRSGAGREGDCQYYGVTGRACGPARGERSPSASELVPGSELKRCTY